MRHQRLLGQTLRFWNVETGEAVHVFRGHTAEVYAMSLHEGSKHAISASDDKTLMLWNLDTYITSPPAPETPPAIVEQPQQ